MKHNLTIIMYHYIRDLHHSRFPEIKGLDLDLFKEQILYLKKYYNFVSMEEVIDSIYNGNELPSKSVLLTFDDAYLDHYVNVFPILDHFNIKGSFYAPAKAISEHTVLDVNKIHFILASVNEKNDIVNKIKELLAIHKDEFNLESFNFYYEKLAKPSRLDSANVVFIKRLLQVELVEKLRIKIVDQLFQQYTNLSEQAFSRELYMNEDHLKHLLRNGHHVGNHGYNHYWWNSLSEKEMSNELDLSINFLSSLGVDMSNWTACYPYGSYDQQAMNMLADRGCKLALSTDIDIASIKSNNRFRLPRLDTNEIPKDRNSEVNKWFNVSD